MKWIVGLGNPGPRYDGTPHNLGFQVVDELARRWSLGWKMDARSNALLAEGAIKNQPARLVKPLTFMNLSGNAVAVLTRQQPLGEDDLLVVADDVAIPIGRLRLRPEGSHGGHNGLRSMIERLGHSNFARLRVGIGPVWPVDDLVAYVLCRLPPLERAQLTEMTEVAADAAESWLETGSKRAADKFNGQKRFTSGA